MWTAVGALVALAIVLVAFGVVFFVGLRRGSPLVRDVVRGFNRTLMNPHQMKTAGTRGAYASVVRHVGRTTGRTHETPLVAFPTDDGFVIALPYGSGTDWLKNVVAKGSATIVHEGAEYRVDQPELVPVSTAAPFMPAKEVRQLRRFSVDRCLRVRNVVPARGVGTREERIGARQDT